MKALSIQEPWSSLIYSGKKTIETRTWNTNYRGRILLCASKNPKGELSGHAFATAEIEDCIPMVPEHEARACCLIYPGAYSWLLKDVRPLDKLFPVKGQLGLFEVNYG